MEKNTRLPASLLAARRTTRDEFAKRLRTAMDEKNQMTQAELARQSGIKRDSISTYFRAITLPDPGNLTKLAKALDMNSYDLLPSRSNEEAFSEPPAFTISAIPDEPNKVWFHIDRAMTPKQATQIMTILSEDI